MKIENKISDYQHVAVMLSPQSMSVEGVFDREDNGKDTREEICNIIAKHFGLSSINSCQGETEERL